jgi:CheY-like chemotaxis protein
MYKVRLLEPLPLEDNDLRIVVALSIRPGQSRSEHELGTILWGGLNWGNEPNPERLRSPITRARQHIPIPNKQRGVSTYRADLSRSEVDLTDFIDRVATSTTLEVDEVDRLLGMWEHDPAVTFDFLPGNEFKPLARARTVLIRKLIDWSQQELAQLTNLEKFRGLFESECESIPVPSPRREKRILLVDDNPGLTSMLKDLLGGYETVIANTIGEAMSIISDETARIDGALVDLHLSDRLDSHGINVLDALRMRRPDVPRVLMTSSPPADGMKGFAERYGLFEVLVKNGPDAPAHTRSLVEEMLSDRPEHAIGRTRATLQTLAGRAHQLASRAVVDARRRSKRGEASRESLEVAADRLDAVESATLSALEAINATNDPAAAKQIVADFAATFSEYLTSDESAR